MIKEFFTMLMFDCARKHNRDGLGIWKMQFGLVIIIWLLLIRLILTVVEAVPQ